MTKPSEWSRLRRGAVAVLVAVVLAIPLLVAGCRGTFFGPDEPSRDEWRRPGFTNYSGPPRAKENRSWWPFGSDDEDEGPETVQEFLSQEKP